MKKLNHTTTRTETLYGLIYIALQILVLPEVLKRGNTFLGTPLSPAQLNFALFSINFICVTVIFHRYLLEGIRQVLNSPLRFLRYAGLGFLFYWLGSILVNIVIFAVYPDFANVNDASVAEMTKQNFPLMFIGTVLLVPVAEETLFRGVVFGNLYTRNRIIGYILSAMIFSALHVIGYIGYFQPVHLLLCFLQYIPAGVCLAWAYAMADTIFAPILMHTVINLIGVMAMR